MQKKDPFECFKRKIKEKSICHDTSSDENDNSDKTSHHLSNNIESTESVLQNESEEFEYVFLPRPEITTYDLSRILAMTQLMITNDIYQKFPDELKKFFIKVEEVNNISKI